MKLAAKHMRAVFLATAIAVSPATSLAQSTVTTDDANYNRVERDDDDDFPWGLLGLLGLAGLLGLKRRDDARDVHVDARRDTRK